MKYFIAFLLFFNILFANQSDLTPEEKEWLKNNEIIISADQAYPLTFTNKDNEIDGIFAEIFNIIKKKYNLKTKVVTDTWSQIFQKFNKGHIDLIVAAAFTQERAKFANYSSVVHQFKIFFM
ncbi:transporter substrate-binding domain-containing protein [Poseidonibacter ostreae]|uniref:Transporter substrate-binding domain-containing protein n=1 Tax=Poseidonibacter ostreae TaxID=2654171 RepID=A0A6L4WNH7_9BACT|nr:transporter substrate-binding domain-containing protein [Poseidonibacter ostreae]KAB7883028.1 transporter substrate-binding domain-containing protein [Poseidonibacter ostreae]KAB7884915.1 transporter substrate-binding domain-containing protein [Poseidonibacter ostreae]KAB7887397.1 transporter substrate-binding domain-containing protein [Poseidonibacter ostreae]